MVQVSLLPGRPQRIRRRAACRCRVREADVQCQLVAADRGTEADTDNFQFTGEALRNADDHVVQQRAGCAVQLFEMLLIVRTNDFDFIAVDIDLHVFVKLTC